MRRRIVPTIIHTVSFTFIVSRAKPFVRHRSNWIISKARQTRAVLRPRNYVSMTRARTHTHTQPGLYETIKGEKLTDKYIGYLVCDTNEKKGRGTKKKYHCVSRDFSTDVRKRRARDTVNVVYILIDERYFQCLFIYLCFCYFI